MATLWTERLVNGDWVTDLSHVGDVNALADARRRYDFLWDQGEIAQVVDARGAQVTV